LTCRKTPVGFEGQPQGGMTIALEWVFSASCITGAVFSHETDAASRGMLTRLWIH